MSFVDFQRLTDFQQLIFLGPIGYVVFAQAAQVRGVMAGSALFLVPKRLLVALPELIGTCSIAFGRRMTNWLGRSDGMLLRTGRGCG